MLKESVSNVHTRNTRTRTHTHTHTHAHTRTHVCEFGPWHEAGQTHVFCSAEKSLCGRVEDDCGCGACEWRRSPCGPRRSLTRGHSKRGRGGKAEETGRQLKIRRARTNNTAQHMHMQATCRGTGPLLAHSSETHHWRGEADLGRRASARCVSEVPADAVVGWQHLHLHGPHRWCTLQHRDHLRAAAHTHTHTQKHAYTHTQQHACTHQFNILRLVSDKRKKDQDHKVTAAVLQCWCCWFLYLCGKGGS